MEYFHTPVKFLDSFICIAPDKFIQPVRLIPYIPVTFQVEVRGNRELSLRTFKDSVLRFIGSNRVVIVWIEPEEIKHTNVHVFRCSINVIDEES